LRRFAASRAAHRMRPAYLACAARVASDHRGHRRRTHRASRAPTRAGNFSVAATVASAVSPKSSKQKSY
jgi:hypothetical protein